MSPIPTDIYTLCPFPLDFPSTTQFTIFDNFYLCPSLDPASTSSSCPVSLLTLLKKVFIFFQPQIFLSLKKKNLFAPSSRFLSRSVGDYKYPAKETFWKTNQICRNHFSSSWQKSNWSQCDWSWKSIKWSLYNKQVGWKVLTEIVQKQKLISNFTKCYKKRQEVKLNY